MIAAAATHKNLLHAVVTTRYLLHAFTIGVACGPSIAGESCYILFRSKTSGTTGSGHNYLTVLMPAEMEAKKM